MIEYSRKPTNALYAEGLMNTKERTACLQICILQTDSILNSIFANTVSKNIDLF